MDSTITYNNTCIRINLQHAVDLSLPIDPHGRQASFYAPYPARAEHLQVGDFIGNIAAGGSCNAEAIQFIPHCHGTHTECVSHLLQRPEHVHDTIAAPQALALLLTIAGEHPQHCPDTYHAELTEHDRLISRAALQAATRLHSMWSCCRALILRCQPGPLEDKLRDYDQQPGYPILSSEAMHWLSQQTIDHLVIDTPSIDRAADGGILGNHRLFWGLENEQASAQHPQRSVTEMAHIPDTVNDGLYWLQIELSPIRSDATPSRPMIYPLEAL